MRRRDFIAGIGGVAAWPLAARTQQPVMPVIGILDFLERQPKSAAIEEFRAGLADSGFIEGTNLSIEYRSAGGNSTLLPSLAADLGRQVAVVVAVGAPTPALSAKAATFTIPIVFLFGGDPVKAGLVASLSRPEGNVTGMTSMVGEPSGLEGKRL